MRAHAALIPLSLLGSTVWACSILTDTDGLAGVRADPPDARPSEPSAPMEASAPDGAGMDDDGGAVDGGKIVCPPNTDDTLVGYWPLDETAGTHVKDCSGRGNDGTVLTVADGGAWGQGKRGGAFLGDGTKGCIGLGKPATLAIESGAFTLAAWIYVTAFTTKDNDARYVIGRTSDVSKNGWRLAADIDATYAWTFVPPGGARIDLASANAQPVAAWRHVAVTFEPSGMSRLLVDGVAKAGPAAASIGQAPNADVRIGCRGDSSLHFNGRLDEVRIYRRILTDAEIAALGAP